MRALYELDLRHVLRGDVQKVSVWFAPFALILFGLLRYENFGSTYKTVSHLNYDAMFIVIAVGMAMVIVTGGSDLSVGSVAAFPNR